MNDLTSGWARRIGVALIAAPVVAILASWLAALIGSAQSPHVGLAVVENRIFAIGLGSGVGIDEWVFIDVGPASADGPFPNEEEAGSDAFVEVDRAKRILSVWGDDVTQVALAGWPWRCVTSARQGAEVRGGIEVGNGIVLPTRPIWGGILLNSAVFATAFLVVVSSVVGIRRCALRIRGSRRRVRGQCATCGHLLQECARCQECGTKAVDPH
ncbi:MAG: hypothetical protein KDA25_02770 [Phycisphaerales bacterium]|nr:hypothetical protein [Phycisphaerales bacterium]